MSLKNELAATLRAIRQQRGATYAELEDISAQATISLIEQAKIGVKIDRLAMLTQALDIDLIAFLTLAVAMHNDERPEVVLARAAEDVKAFEAVGGLKQMRSNFEDGDLRVRSRGRPGNQDRATAVRELKAQGLTQTQVAQALGLANSTVHRYWQD